MTNIPMLPPVELGDAELWGRLRPACIVCLGNELACDDGVGIQIGRCLCALPLPSHIMVRFSPQIDLDLIDYLLAAHRVIFCDATRMGQRCGIVSVHDWQTTASLSSQPYCCHGIGLSDLLKIAGELEPHVDRWDIHLVGVEARVLDKFGVELTDEVRVAVPKAVASVLRLLGAPDELCAIAEQVAREARSPPLVDVVTSG